MMGGVGIMLPACPTYMHTHEIESDGYPSLHTLTRHGNLDFFCTLSFLVPPFLYFDSEAHCRHRHDKIGNSN